jgi:hypothetical protein
MPKEKDLYVKLQIPKILYRQTVDQWMFAYVHGYRHISPIPILQVKAGIEAFMVDFGLEEDYYPVDSAVVTFFRMYGESKEIVKIKKYDCNTKRN